jgi:hypothetical protein
MVKKNAQAKSAWSKKNQQMTSPIETPKEHWIKVRHMRGHSQTSSEDSSLFMGKFMDIVQKSNEISQLHIKKVSLADDRPSNNFSA